MGAILCWASLPVSAWEPLSTKELMLYSFASGAVFLYGLDLVQKKTVKIALPGVRASLLGIWGIFFSHYGPVVQQKSVSWQVLLGMVLIIAAAMVGKLLLNNQDSAWIQRGY